MAAAQTHCMSVPVLAFIVVNFDNSSHPRTLCDSLALQQGLGTAFAVDCVVVDNSTMSELMIECAELCSAYAWLRYVRSDSKLGYFGGLNRGLAERPQDAALFVIIANNDLEFSPTVCKSLVD